MTQNCPECGKVLSAYAKLCRCGWKLPIKQETSHADRRCEYQILGKRCPLPGTICHYPYSKEGPWYCTGHANCLDNPKLGEAVLRHAEENYHEILAQRRDWRDIAIAERVFAQTNHKKNQSSNSVPSESNLSTPQEKTA